MATGCELGSVPGWKHFNRGGREEIANYGNNSAGCYRRQDLTSIVENPHFCRKGRGKNGAPEGRILFEMLLGPWAGFQVPGSGRRETREQDQDQSVEKKRDDE